MEAVRFKVVPEQTGELLPAMGALGGELMTTVRVEVMLAHPFAIEVTATEYVPASDVVTLLTTGFCKAEEKLFGPLHE